MAEIRRIKPQVIVATPGRLIDLLENYGLNIDSSKYQILDEGDKMLDMGFHQDIIKIQRFMPQSQSMIFSATVPAYIQEIARKYMKNPIMLDLVGKDEMQLPDTISNQIVLCKDFPAKQTFVKNFVTANRNLKILIFCETKIEVKRLPHAIVHEFVNQRPGDPQDVILAKTMLGFSDFIVEEKPDLVLIHGDRVEALACALVCATNYVKCAHIEGGEVSGTIDEILRHCNSKLAYCHFVSSKTANIF